MQPLPCYNNSFTLTNFKVILIEDGEVVSRFQSGFAGPITSRKVATKDAEAAFNPVLWVK